MGTPQLQGKRLDAQFHSTEVAGLFAAERQIAHMLAFEGALARVQGELGLIPEPAARVIADACADRKLIARIDLSAARVAGNPAIPFVKQLTALVRASDPEAAAWVHHGATSQDVIDTATVLSLRETFAAIIRDLSQLREAIATLAHAHVRTPMIARTLLQHAAATTFGYKLAAALAGLDQCAQRMMQLTQTHFCVQLGGPVGTLSTAGPLAPALVRGVAMRLGLQPAEICWHTNRVRIVECGTALATLTGHLGKIAHDIALQMQSDVAELAEAPAPGKGGSSAMPHKHNPVDSVAASAAAIVTPQLASTLLAAMVQEHERAAGAWHAEWIALPQLCSLTHGAVLAVTQSFRGLRVDVQRMQSNLDAALEFIGASAVAEALAPAMGRDVAHDTVQEWTRIAISKHRPLREVVAQELRSAPHALPPEQLDALFSIDRNVTAADAAARHYLEQRTVSPGGNS
jgi:3-carboxy-cis,cis-muconate cycloisomerase